jgi:hypothetical protein
MKTDSYDQQDSRLSQNKVENQENSFIKRNKTSLGLGFLGLSCLFLVASIRKRTAKTRDFGLEDIMKNPGIRGNVQHASWLWAMQAFGISTAIVGAGFSGLALGLGHYYNVSSVCLGEYSGSFAECL